MKMVISIGSNLDDPISQVRSAQVWLSQTFQVRAHSSLFRTKPVGGPNQDDFINAVTIIETELEPIEILRALQDRELQSGRVRDVRWGPRTLDLDLINVDGVTSDDPQLTLPHPRARERAFVLIPWAEIDSDAILEGVGKVTEITVPSQGVERI